MGKTVLKERKESSVQLLVLHIWKLRSLVNENNMLSWNQNDFDLNLNSESKEFSLCRMYLIVESEKLELRSDERQL